MHTSVKTTKHRKSHQWVGYRYTMWGFIRSNRCLRLVNRHIEIFKSRLQILCFVPTSYHRPELEMMSMQRRNLSVETSCSYHYEQSILYTNTAFDDNRLHIGVTINLCPQVFTAIIVLFICATVDTLRVLNTLS